MTLDVSPESESGTHISDELGLGLALDGDSLVGSDVITPEMCVPGADVLRASILALWTDVVSGLLVGSVIAPRVPVTLDLAVDVIEDLSPGERLQVTGHVVKAGRSVAFTRVDFLSGSGEPVALGTASFMAAPDVTLSMPSLAESLAMNHQGGGRLSRPYAERVGCSRRAAGVAELPRSEEGLNSSKTINGGFIALLAEEAVLSLEPGTALSSLMMRYLRPARTGPLVATASARAGLATVEVRDTGDEDRLAVTATARTRA